MSTSANTIIKKKKHFMKNLSKNIILSILVFIQEQKKYFIQNLPKILTYGILMSILFFSIIYLSVNFADLSILEATKDNQFFKKGESIFYGLISNIGILFWILSLSLNLYGYLSNRKKYQNIFFIGILTSSCLLISDFFDVQNLFYMYGVYFLLTINALFLFFYSTKFPLIKNKLILLFFSFSFFGAAMFLDILQQSRFSTIFYFYPYNSLIEELFEFLGGFYYIFYWLEVIKDINKLKNRQALNEN